MRQLQLSERVVREDVGGPDLARVDALAAQTAGQLHHHPAYLVYGVFVDVRLDDVLQVPGHVLHDDIELVLILDYLVDGGEVLQPGVLHEGQVPVL